MRNKLFISGLLIIVLAMSASAQRIVVDSSSTNKYLIKPEEAKEKKSEAKVVEELTFSDRAISIGQGILNRLKARLNLEEAAESIKDKREKILGKSEENEEG